MREVPVKSDGRARPSSGAAARYLADATLHLEVNGEVRQDAPVNRMKWPINEIANQALLVGTAQRWKLEHEAIGLLTERSLPAHLTFFTGTLAGVAFEPPTEDFIDRARQQYLLEGGIFSGMTLDAYTRARYRQQQQHHARHLELGDTVDARGTFLGSLHVSIDQPASRSSQGRRRGSNASRPTSGWVRPVIWNTDSGQLGKGNSYSWQIGKRKCLKICSTEHRSSKKDTRA